MTAWIEMQQVHFSYEASRPVLDGADLVVQRGERVALVGANGCGKTTLLHLLVGLIQPERGEIVVFGERRREEPQFAEVRRRVGLVFQDADDQLFCPTVLEDVAFGPLNLGRSPEAAREAARAALTKVGLEGFEERVTYRLSGGEKRLVALAGVLAMEPDVLLLDEPGSGLDETARRRILDLLETLPQTMLVATHEEDVIRRVAHRVMRLRDGKLESVNGPR